MVDLSALQRRKFREMIQVQMFYEKCLLCAGVVFRPDPDKLVQVVGSQNRGVPEHNTEVDWIFSKEGSLNTTQELHSVNFLYRRVSVHNKGVTAVPSKGNP
jgi:hypothetical protein